MNNSERNKNDLQSVSMKANVCACSSALNILTLIRCTAHYELVFSVAVYNCVQYKK